MDEVITVNQRINQWKILSNIVKNLPSSSSHYLSTATVPENENQNENQNESKSDNAIHVVSNDIKEEDPFDCSDAIIPPSTQLITNVLQEHLKEWEELDSRTIIPLASIMEEVEENDNGQKRHHNARPNINESNIISNTNDPDTQENNDNDINPEMVEGGDYAGVNWGWHANRIRLPDFFDYTNRRGPPQTMNMNNTMKGQKRRRQVVSLDDPTKLLDYEHELWNLFNNVPLAESIENEYNCNENSSCCCQETMKVSQEIQEGLKEYTRLDGHLLNRLRKRDRHHWPRVNIQRKKYLNNSRDRDSGLGEICGATIRIECWRKQLKRGSGCDSNR